MKFDEYMMIGGFSHGEIMTEYIIMTELRPYRRYNYSIGIMSWKYYYERLRSK